MIGDLWARWFDSREQRRAREVAEANYSQLLIRCAELTDRVAELARLEMFARADLDAANTLLADAKARNGALERQLEEQAKAHATAVRVATGHIEASRLPPQADRDRQALYRLTDENETLRAYREHCLKEHR